MIHEPLMDRRHLLLGAALVAALPSLPAAAADTAPAALEVCPGTALSSIAQALELAPPGSTVIVQSGRCAAAVV